MKSSTNGIKNLYGKFIDVFYKFAWMEGQDFARVSLFSVHFTLFLFNPKPYGYK